MSQSNTQPPVCILTVDIEALSPRVQPLQLRRLRTAHELVGYAHLLLEEETRDGVSPWFFGGRDLVTSDQMRQGTDILLKSIMGFLIPIPLYTLGSM